MYDYNPYDGTSAPTSDHSPWSAYKDSITSVSFENGITSIGKYAFYGYKNLAGDLNIPDGVTSIGQSAFANDKAMTGTLRLPHSLTTIGNAAFSLCTFSGKIVIPEKVNNIPANAFGLDTTSTVTYIDWLYTESNPILTDQSFSNNLYGMMLMTATPRIIVHSDTVYDEVEYQTNENTNSGKNVVTNITPTPVGNIKYAIDDTTKTLTIWGNGDMPIYNLMSPAPWVRSGATSVIIADGVTSVGSNSFVDMDMSSGNLYKGMGLIGEVYIPDSVTSIGSSAFSSGTDITSIVLPSYLVSIGANAFDGCTGLTGDMIIPSTIVSIGSESFKNCTNPGLNVYLLNSAVDASALTAVTNSVNVYSASSTANANLIALTNNTTTDAGLFGGQIRLKETDNGKQDLRMKYVFHTDVLPAGSTATGYGFNWGKDGATDRTLTATNYIKTGSTVASNIVVTNIPIANYKTNITAKGVVTFVNNGKTFEVSGDVMEKNVYDVAVAAKDAGDNADAMQAIIDAVQ